MKTDSWFYRFLKTWPAGFFELLGRPASEAARYHLEAVELKKESVRIDGVFRPLDPAHPVYFLEIQG
jgi:predicted transposase YdaD